MESDWGDKQERKQFTNSLLAHSLNVVKIVLFLS